MDMINEAWRDLSPVAQAVVYVSIVLAVLLTFIVMLR